MRVRSTCAEPRLQAGEPLAQPPPVNFELRFTGTARSDAAASRAAAANARKMRPLARQARLQITELRDLDLEFAFERVRALRENIEDQLAAIDHTDLEFVLEIARLRGTERVVENRERRALRLRQFAHLAGLALADESARIRRLQALPNDAGNFGAGALGQCFQFVERFFAADPRLGTKFDSNQDGALVMLVNNVVRLSQVNTSIAAKSTIQPIRYRRTEVRHPRIAEPQ